MLKPYLSLLLICVANLIYSQNKVLMVDSITIINQFDEVQTITIDTAQEINISSRPIKAMSFYIKNTDNSNWQGITAIWYQYSYGDKNFMNEIGNLSIQENTITLNNLRIIDGKWEIEFMQRPNPNAISINNQEFNSLIFNITNPKKK